MDIWDKPNILHKTSVMKIISSKLAAVYNNEWFAQISTVKTKLRTNCTFKTQLNQENYVHIILDYHFVNSVFSAHQLMIGKGRYVIRRLPPENKICQICNLNAVEDEFHFIMKCSAYNYIRFTLLKQTDETLVTQNFSNMDYFLRFTSASEFDLFKVVADYVSSAFNIRANLM